MREQKKKYFAVECKCGHVGSKQYYIPITFAVMANDGREAANAARNFPRCKHHHKDCILSVEEISYAEYLKLLAANMEDPYLHCSNKFEQSTIDIESRLVIDPHYEENAKCDKEKEGQIHQVYFRKEKIRNPKKFVKFNQDYLEAC